MNLDSNCHDLDAYLSHDLPGDKHAIFEAHLEGCQTCRDAVDQQQWIDNLLHSPARIQLELPSATIVESLRNSAAQRRRHIMKVACGSAVAATLLIAVGLSERHRQAIGTLKIEEPRIAVTEPIHAPTPRLPAATFVGTSDAIVVPLESPSADVTIVQVYPTTDAERRSRLELTLTSTSTKPNGG